MPKLINKYEDIVCRLDYFNPLNLSQKTLFNYEISNNKNRFIFKKDIDNHLINSLNKVVYKKLNNIKTLKQSCNKINILKDTSKYEYTNKKKLNNSCLINKNNLHISSVVNKNIKNELDQGVNNFENITIESKLDAKFKKTQENLFLVNEKLSTLYNINERLRKRIEDTKLEIIVIENYEKCSNEKEQNIINQITSNKGLKLYEKEKIIQEKIIILRQSIKKQHFQREDNLRKKKILLSNLKEEESKLLKDIYSNNLEKESLKSQITTIKNNILMHLHKILKLGLDSRKEGLTWIIQYIWHLGERVHISLFPNFLDEKSIEYLFKVINLTFINNKKIILINICKSILKV